MSPGLVENRPAHAPADAQGPTDFGKYEPVEMPPAPKGRADGDRSVGPQAMQVHNSYLVIQTPDGIEIVDQHALHERILYNELRARLADGRLAGQRMLIPATLPVSPAEAARLEQHAGLLGRLGIEVSQFGPNTMAVQQFPSLLAGRGVDPASFLREMLDRLAEDETIDSERLIEDVLAMMSCKAAVKAGQSLTAQEIDSLLERARTAEKSSACPHGRPTTLRLTLKDLEKQFHRT
jgi:DNA mismatch repair protein MutL